MYKNFYYKPENTDDPILISEFKNLKSAEQNAIKKTESGKCFCEIFAYIDDEWIHYATTHYGDVCIINPI